MRIPADVDREDRLLAGLSARQLAILAVPAVALWAAYLATRAFLPLPVFAAVALPVGVAAAALALGRRHGLSADRLALAALGHARSAHRLVPAPEGVSRPPAWLGADQEGPPTPLGLPAQGLDQAGVVELGPDGAALVCRASSLNFGLRSEAEQEALVAAFGRFVNSVAAPFQVLVRAEPADLGAALARLEEAAGGLPHPALEGAAREHAGFLGSLAARRDVLRRYVLVVLREPALLTGAEDVLRRRAREAAVALEAAGVTLTALDGDEAAAVLAASYDQQAAPRPAGLAAPGVVVGGRL